MSYPESQAGKKPLPAPEFATTAPPAESLSLHPNRLTILEEHLDGIRDQLARPEAAIDTDRVRELLLELSADIRSRTSVFQSGDYRWILDRLTQIYAQGLGQQTQEPFATTAAAYAQVIETISHADPGHDYNEAIGQLFCYMSRLFRTQENGWKAIYEHILSIPDSVEAKQLLNRAFFVEIQEWAEAGVENLFSIRKGLLDKIGELEAKIQGIDRQIAIVAGEPKQTDQTNTDTDSSNVIDLAWVRQQRLIAALEQRRGRLSEQMDEEKFIVGLIESDIQEFEEKLRNTRRAYFVQPVRGL